MRSSENIILFFLLVFIGCKQQETKEKDERLLTSKSQIPETHHHLKEWAEDINSKNSGALRNTYDSNAVKVISADSILDNPDRIAQYYGAHNYTITAIRSLFNIEANKSQRIHYEILDYSFDNSQEFIGVVIGRMENGRMIRLFEYTAESNGELEKADTATIGARRKRWMELCNENNPVQLVNELYSHNTLYFNHKPIVKGIAAVAKEYGYMNNPNYKLMLHPAKLQAVNADLAIEIGACSGSYNGKYILVWKKGADGIWKVFIDSNI